MPDLNASIAEFCAETPGLQGKEQDFTEYMSRCILLWDDYGFCYVNPRSSSIHIFINKKDRGSSMWPVSLVKNHVLERALSISDPLFTVIPKGNPMMRIAMSAGFGIVDEQNDLVQLRLDSANLRYPEQAKELM